MSGGTGYVSEGFEYRLLEIVTQNLEFTWRFEGRGVGREALLESLDRVWDPEVPVKPQGLLSGTHRSHKGAGLFLRSGDRIGALMHLDPEVAWEPGESYMAFEVMLAPGGLDPEIVVWNPDVMTPMRPRLQRGSNSFRNPEATVLRLPRQDYYRYQFGFRILPLRSLPLSSSCAVFYFCRKSLTGLEGAGVGVMTQVPGLCCFPPRSALIKVLFTLVLWGPRCALGRTEVLGSFDSILRLAHTHSCFMSHTRFDSLWACRCGGATFMRIGQDRRSLET
ncbi:hypothetical protein F2Q69_00042906 [Brassica cretica]|uniref:Uncharacterized protein n=1 Tax=Brassica cretica TaxID=69181 RepID=A0A8S9NFB3_BRACR|nr:hypothetical protein F2Q69_00042906 [Brassica cretica]